ncbi:hypothetical protein SAMN05216374_1137 [Tardiphaga sp. OK246]|uniref:hypothetical protein n=1 Tax=Tardiphaga sp. OK246 TaxID=1855307 RepID=UPI000B6245E9|nr:hypothetical protein [Tardiphaga sp. OK246]SNS39840.1 hypothetical protein SAMN05216374_1137 [Tardiphaga sp. OK246]
MQPSLVTSGSSAAATRTCGTCTMCCKVYRIDDLAKPAGKWCKHCAIAQGCKIYDSRPQQCRAFDCVWIQDDEMPESWKPENSKIVFSVYPTTGFIYGQVDPGTPFAWQKEPIHSGLIAWSEKLLAERRHLLIFVGGNATLIMPTGPVPIGPMSPADGFIIRETFTAKGKDYIATRVPSGR